MSTSKKPRIVHVSEPAKVTVATNPVATTAPASTTLTAKELLAILPKPIMEPTQRQYGEEFYPAYVRAYNRVQAAAQ